MFSSVISGLVQGADCRLIRVEVDISNGFPAYMMIGCLASEVKESRDRVTTALKNAGVILKPARITVNLSPGDLRKAGTIFDLPIAAALMAAAGFIPYDALQDAMLIGELGLDGTVCGTRGILSLVYEAKNAGIKRCIIPEENYEEAVLIRDIEVISVSSLGELIDLFKGIITIKPAMIGSTVVEDRVIRPGCSELCDFGDLRGQEGLKRAIEVAVAGFHHLLMVGPPGTGKSMAASCIPSILPDMNFDESVEVTRLYSIAGLLGNQGGLITKRPFRQPHHTITPQAMVGGGAIPMPGEISLAQNGVLFLDELGEYNPTIIETLRQPLENRNIMINRINGSSVFPGNFMLVAAMNPCPCGFYPNRERCSCTSAKIRHYLRHVSHSILDRFDLGYEVPELNTSKIDGLKLGRNSKSIKKNIERAWQIADKRYADRDFRFNSQIPAADVQLYCKMDDQAKSMLQMVCEDKLLTMRGKNKLIRVARTIADLDESSEINGHHMAEAIGLRSLDEKYWQGELWI